MFGINGGEVLVLLLIAIVVVGPQRLPEYAEQLGRWTRRLRAYVTEAKAKVAEEMGEEAADLDWESLDPRRYDPRRIVREALADEPPPPVLGRQYTSGRARDAAGRASAGAAVSGAAAGAAGAAAAARRGPSDGEGRAAVDPARRTPAPFDPDLT